MVFPSHPHDIAIVSDTKKGAMAAMVTSVKTADGSHELPDYSAPPVQTSATYSGTFSKYRFWMPGNLHSLASTNILTVMSFILEQELRICPSARFTISFHKLLLLQCRLFSTTSTSSPSSFRSLWLHVQDYGGSLAYSSIFYHFLLLLSSAGTTYSPSCRGARTGSQPRWHAGRPRSLQSERQVVTKPAVRHGTYSFKLFSPLLYSFSLFSCFWGPPSQFHWVPCCRCTLAGYPVAQIDPLCHTFFLFCFCTLLLVCCCWRVVRHELHIAAEKNGVS